MKSGSVRRRTQMILPDLARQTMSDSLSPHPLIDIDWIREACGDSSLSPSACLRRQDDVGPNILFDTHYYRATYGQRIPVGMTCLEHFCRRVKDDFLDPNATFSTRLWHRMVGAGIANAMAWRSALFR